MMRCWLFVLGALVVQGCAGPSQGRLDYPSGNKLWVYQIEHGLPEGRSVRYHRNGEIASQGSYRDGVRHGVFRYFDDLGTLQRVVVYIDGRRRWRSRGQAKAPPPELLTELREFHGARRPRVASGIVSQLALQGPSHFFGSLDRTEPTSRFGLVVGTGGRGDAQVPGLGPKRYEVFGLYTLGQWSAYGRMTQTEFSGEEDVDFGGRRIAEAGVLAHLGLGPAGRLSPRLGLSGAIANDDPNGAVASALASFMRPTDSADAVRGATAVRTSASWALSRQFVALQTDLGVDWLVGDGNFGTGIGHVNAGFGLGKRGLMAVLETSSAVPLGSPGAVVLSAGAGATIRSGRVWLNAVVARTTMGFTTVLASGGFTP